MLWCCLSINNWILKDLGNIDLGNTDLGNTGPEAIARGAG